MTAPPEPRGGEGLRAELFQRLDQILVEESPMHPFGCATWMEATQVAIDMAKEALSRPVVHGWPDREAVARVIDPDTWEHVDQCHEAMKAASKDTVKVLQSVADRRLRESDSLTKADAILALFPPVVQAGTEGAIDAWLREDVPLSVGSLLSPANIADLKNRLAALTSEAKG